MAFTIYSDFTPIPQVMLPHAREAFVARSIELGGLIGGPGSGAAIEVVGDMGFGMGGVYVDAPFVKNAVAVRKRDITSVSDLTPVQMTGANNRGVLVHRSSELVQITDDARWGGWNMAQLNVEFGKQMGEKVFDDMLSAAISMMIGAVEAVGSSDLIYSVWSATDKVTLSPDVIDDGRQLLGDARKNLKFLLTHSASLRDLRKDATGRGYDTVGGRTLAGQDGLNSYGLIIADRDESILTVADAGFDKYKTLLLGPGAVRVGFAQPVEIESDRYIKGDAKSSFVRADWSLNLQQPNSEYDSTGGVNPTNTVLATSSSYTYNHTSIKSMPIVELVHNYSRGS